MFGTQIHEFAKELWSLNRSITGNGVRETLKRIKNHNPKLIIKSIKTGTKVFDWTVPEEWHVNEAYIITPEGEKICNFSQNNLHLVGYSSPFEGELSLNELQNHLFSIPDQPEAIPYVTSYYKKNWGFCISHDQREKLNEGQYKILIDSKHFNGEMNYGELIIKGNSQKEVFLSTYICHPSMANNELSGPTVVTFLAKWLSSIKNLNYTYRIIFIPETIGSISYLSLNYKYLKKNVFAGFNISCVGDDRAYSYLPSRNGGTISDLVAKHVLKWIDSKFISYKWTDRGSDERQYCSPGIDLPIASIMRTKYGDYPEYHTSLDNLIDVVTPKGLEGGYWAIRKSIDLLERNQCYKVLTLGEPQLSKRDMYPSISKKDNDYIYKVMLDFISYCDGEHSVLNIADKIDKPCWELYEIIENLLENKIISLV